MMRMRGHGFALVTSLLVLLVVAALGAGAVFLTITNLRIAENVQAQAIARSNAEGDLERLFVILANYAADVREPRLPVAGSAEGSIGDVLSESSIWSDGAGSNIDYQRFPSADFDVQGDQARIRLVGTGPRNSQHAVEALVEAVWSFTEGGGTAFQIGDGFVAEGDIDINGVGTYDINFYSGSDIDLAPGKISSGREGVANGSCVFGAPKQNCTFGYSEPIVVEAPVFTDIRAGILSDPDLGISCSDYTATSVPFGASNQVICLAPGATVTVSGDVSNLVIIGDASTTVNIEGKAGRLLSDPKGLGLLVTSGTVNFGGSAEFYATNAIYAVNDIVFGNNVVSNDETARTLIVTEGNFRLNGTGATSIYASFWVGGDFRWNGTPDKFRGTILAKGKITGNGCGSFCNVAPPESLDFVVDPDLGGPRIFGIGIEIVSRR